MFVRRAVVGYRNLIQREIAVGLVGAYAVVVAVVVVAVGDYRACRCTAALPVVVAVDDALVVVELRVDYVAAHDAGRFYVQTDGDPVAALCVPLRAALEHVAVLYAPKAPEDDRCKQRTCHGTRDTRQVALCNGKRDATSRKHAEFPKSHLAGATAGWDAVGQSRLLHEPPYRQLVQSV